MFGKSFANVRNRGEGKGGGGLLHPIPGVAVPPKMFENALKMLGAIGCLSPTTPPGWWFAENVRNVWNWRALLPPPLPRGGGSPENVWKLFGTGWRPSPTPPPGWWFLPRVFGQCSENVRNWRVPPSHHSPGWGFPGTFREMIGECSELGCPFSAPLPRGGGSPEMF